MNEDEMVLIRVPASTANLGPGFDSVGLALNLYLTIEAEISSKWEIIFLTEELQSLPTDETNFISQTAIYTASLFQRQMPPCRLKVKSSIPLARGLGSSAAAIVAAIELADVVCQLSLSKQEKLEIASRIEGHPDNVGASLFGGLVIGQQTAEEVNCAVFSNISFDVVAVIPKEELLTKDSRGVLPDQLSFQEAVQAGATANLLVASLISGDWEMAGKMMRNDLYHQPYRRNLVPHLGLIEKHALDFGAFGVALSGAGPAVICCTETDKGERTASLLKDLLPDMEVLNLKIDQVGSKVTTEKLSCL